MDLQLHGVQFSAQFCFLMYVNKLPELIKSSIKLFADASKVWHKITSENDTQILQQDLIELQNSLQLDC